MLQSRNIRNNNMQQRMI